MFAGAKKYQGRAHPSPSPPLPRLGDGADLLEVSNRREIERKMGRDGEGEVGGVRETRRGGKREKEKERKMNHF